MRRFLEIIEKISTVAFVSGVLCNLLLLYIIRRFSTKELGTYKYLLAIFTAYDTYVIVMIHTVNPKTIPSSTGFSFASDRDYGNFPLSVFYASTYAIPFFLLNIHLLYRYWIITAPYKIERFSQKKFQAWLVGATIFTVICTIGFVGTLARPEDEAQLRHYQLLFRQQYGRDTNDGCLIVNYWKDGRLSFRPILLLVVANRMEICSLCVATMLATRTYRAIIEARHISETARTFHLHILIAASAQTLTPLILMYAPFFVVINMPMLHIYSPTYSALSMVPVLCFPFVAAVVIIVFITPYRKGFLKLLGRKEHTSVKIIASAFSTSVNSSNE